MPSTLTVDAAMPWSVVEVPGSGISRYMTSASDQYGGEILQVCHCKYDIILYCDHVMYVVVYLLIAGAARTRVKRKDDSW